MAMRVTSNLYLQTCLRTSTLFISMISFCLIMQFHSSCLMLFPPEFEDDAVFATYMGNTNLQIWRPNSQSDSWSFGRYFNLAYEFKMHLIWRNIRKQWIYDVTKNIARNEDLCIKAKYVDTHNMTLRCVNKSKDIAIFTKGKKMYAYSLVFGRKWLQTWYLEKNVCVIYCSCYIFSDMYIMLNMSVVLVCWYRLKTYRTVSRIFPLSFNVQKTLFTSMYIFL